MSVNPKSTKDMASDAEKAEALGVSAAVGVATLMHKGVERLADLHKLRLNICEQQTADTVSTLKNIVPNVQSTPGMFLVDLAVKGVEGLVEMQKSMLGVMVQQSGAVLDSMKQSGDSAVKAARGVGTLVRETTDLSVAGLKTVLDYAAQQNKTVTEMVKRQSGVTGTPAEAAADSVQRGVSAVIDAQKDFLELAGKPLKAAVERG